ncbi:hypothetical protein PUV54_07255 [Hyphococcus flavus]|uniref:Lipoprotein n=1 Tax=Hyphococcus flavus TaxID=1866326 RepID=A0AAE9ZDE7_9PROT|nr:hypothetical protein [Hyphococcus flavus]WDI32993.1 hypothetical protein PUV54_07255 [Hyphococcus flavus]
MQAQKVMSTAAMSLCIAIVLSGCATAQDVTKPAVLTFGASAADMTAALETHCTEQNLREISPPSMPGVSSQTQIDCEGFSYFGAPRLAEFVFGDDALTLVWILTEKSEEEALIAAFKNAYGAPSHETTMFTAFADDCAAVRKDVPEALYYAPAASDGFQAWFDQQAAQE